MRGVLWFIYRLPSDCSNTDENHHSQDNGMNHNDRCRNVLPYNWNYTRHKLACGSRLYRRIHCPYNSNEDIRQFFSRAEVVFPLNPSRLYHCSFSLLLVIRLLKKLTDEELSSVKKYIIIHGIILPLTIYHTVLSVFVKWIIAKNLKFPTRTDNIGWKKEQFLLKLLLKTSNYSIFWDKLFSYICKFIYLQ